MQRVSELASQRAPTLVGAFALAAEDVCDGYQLAGCAATPEVVVLHGAQAADAGYSFKIDKGFNGSAYFGEHVAAVQ